MTITIIQQAPSPSEVKVRHTQANVTLHVTPPLSRVQNPGTLYIADECLYFFSTVSNSGFAIPYPSIIIHAIARESAVGPSIYCQLDGSLAGTEPVVSGASNKSNGNNGEEEEEEEEEDAVLEMTFVPADVSSLDTIYENLSYCASLHQDEGDFMDEDDDYYQDDVNDHDGLYADADIQGGYIPKASSATAIGHAETTSSSLMTAPENGNDAVVEAMPAIDLTNGEWFTGNAETDAKFELSEQGQVTIERMEKSQRELLESRRKSAAGKRSRQEEEGEEQAQGGGDDDGDEDDEMADENMGTEEEQQEARAKMWRANLSRMEAMIQDPKGLIQTTTEESASSPRPRPEDEEPGEDAEEDRFKSI
ncbi:hypothetical protein BGZ94_002333 [Podila epigama]|nr:hypothetical protein BGZ94_002333 [Podila epigama]